MLIENARTARAERAATVPASERLPSLFLRVGYYDFRAYSARLECGRYQGFVLVRRHMLTGTVQRVFRAGRSACTEADAMTEARARLSKLVDLVAESPARLHRDFLHAPLAA